MKFMWAYPRNQLKNLERCILFYGTEAEYRRFLQDECATKKAYLDRTVRLSARFARLAVD